MPAAAFSKGPSHRVSTRRKMPDGGAGSSHRTTAAQQLAFAGVSDHRLVDSDHTEYRLELRWGLRYYSVWRRFRDFERLLRFRPRTQSLFLDNPLRMGCVQPQCGTKAERNL